MGFQQGLSGLHGAAKNLDVIGNNIANASTVGFKSSATQFADVYATSLYGTGGLQVGIGSKVADVAQQFTQGSVSTTNNPLDLAISGEGFFLVNQGGATAYTRNGQFHLDKPDTSGLSYIIKSQGLELMGYGVDAFGNIVTSSPAPLRISFSDIAPRSTENANLVANLDSTKTAIAGVIDPTNASSYHHSTSFTLYDGAGNAHSFVLYFQKSASNTWDVDGYVNGNPIDMNTLDVSAAPSANNNGTATVAAAVSAAGDTNLNAGPITLTYNGATGEFDITGANPPVASMAYVSGATMDVNGVEVTISDGPGAPVAPQDGDTFTLSLGKTMSMSFNPDGTIDEINGAAAAAYSITVPGLGAVPTDVLGSGAGSLSFSLDLTNFTQYGSQFGVNSVSQDGYSSGRLAGLSVAEDGTIEGRYTNSQSKTLGQVALAYFANTQGLQPIGSNLWVDSAEAGQAAIGAPGSGVLGVLQSGAVEESNVDLTAELVNLIVAQRMYQANAQTVRAQDQILQTLVNLR